MREVRLKKNEACFTKYLPENMSWEDFDNIIERAIDTIAVSQMIERHWLGPWVSKKSVELYLLGLGYSDDVARLPTLVSWLRLICTKRVIPSGEKIGLPKVRPAIT